MTSKKKMTAQEEYEFYKDPKNLEPQGPPVRRRNKLTELVPVRFAPETLEKVKELAEAEDRSVSSWIRRAVDAALSARAGGRARRTG